MTPLRDALYAKHPRLFPTRVISVGEGWIPLFTTLCDYLQDQIDANGSAASPCPQLYFTTVKEKYGTLRLYHGWDLKGLKWEDYSKRHWYLYEWLGAVAYVEHLSSLTCEVTGKPGSLYVSDNDSSTGWYRTLCAEEAARLGFVPVPPPADCP